ncbi:hypothetical protein OAX78_02405 [Planctomycetota bacterium]|nr:hypothetical protein [Planctomycetota bacterium]
MATINCSECAEPMPAAADECPSCGAPAEEFGEYSGPGPATSSGGMSPLFYVLAGVVALIVIGCGITGYFVLFVDSSSAAPFVYKIF